MVFPTHGCLRTELKVWCLVQTHLNCKVLEGENLMGLFDLSAIDLIDDALYFGKSVWKLAWKRLAKVLDSFH